MRFVLFAGTFLFCLSLQAQKKGQELLDSLVAELPAAKEDTNKVKLLNRITQQYISINPKEGFRYANMGLQLSEKISWKRGIANINNNLGLMTGDTGNNTASRGYFEKSFSINKELDSKPHMITNLNNIGRSYQREGEYSKASTYYFKALGIADDAGNKEQAALVGTNIIALYLVQQDYKQVEKYAALTIKNGEEGNAPVHVAKARELLGVAKIKTGDTAAARMNLEKALGIYETLGNKLAVVQVLSNMATLEEPDYKKAIAVLLRVQGMVDEIAPASLISISNLGNLGTYYYNLGTESSLAVRKEAFVKASGYLQRALSLSNETGNAQYAANFSAVLSQLEEERGNYKEALAYQRSAGAINDSLFSQENKNKIAALESEKAISIKDKEIELNQLTLAAERRQRYALIVVAGLLAVLGGLLYYQNRTRKRTNTTLLQLNGELDEANKVKARFFAILSHDLRGPVSRLVHFLHLRKEEVGWTAEQAAGHEQKITESAESLLENMEAMLTWSKGQMENFRPNLREVMVTELFSYLKIFFISAENVQLLFHDPGGLKVTTDENYLKTIMHNLTANAVKALRNTRDAKIIWSARQEGDKVLLSITDNGPGVPDEQVQVLQNEAAPLSSKGGLGFHLVRDLAKAIQCKISVQSKPLAGTTFNLSV